MGFPAWHVHPDVVLILGSVVAAYLVTVRRHDRRPGEEPTSRRQVHLFLGGMAVLLVGAEWPIHDLAERYLYFFHMIQHMLFSTIAAPLLLAGTPAWMLRRLLAPRPIAVVVRTLVRPVVAFFVFTAVLLSMHWPAVVDASVGNQLLHFGLHVLLVGSSIVMWWPVVSPLPELPPLAAPGQMLYLFFLSLAPTIPASFLTFGSRPLYVVYATFPRLWGISVLRDQLIAGLIMKLVGSFILWVVIAVIFFRWYGREQRDEPGAIRWSGVEHDIRAEMR